MGRAGCWRGASAALRLSPVTLSGHAVCVSVPLTLHLARTVADTRVELTPAFGGVFKGDTTAFSPLIPCAQRPPLSCSSREGVGGGWPVSRQHPDGLIEACFRLMQPGPKGSQKARKAAAAAAAAPAGPDSRPGGCRSPRARLALCWQNQP